MLADEVEFAFELIGLFAMVSDKDLHYFGLVAKSNLTHATAVYGHIAVANGLEALSLNKVVECLYALLSCSFVLGEENKTGSILASVGQLGHHALKELMRHLYKDASTVATLVVSSLGTAVSHVDVHLKSAPDYVVGLLALDVGHEADTARVMLVGWIVETLSLGKSSLCHCR